MNKGFKKALNVQIEAVTFIAITLLQFHPIADLGKHLASLTVLHNTMFLKDGSDVRGVDTWDAGLSHQSVRDTAWMVLWVTV